MNADAVLTDGIIVDDDAVQKSRAHFMLVVPRSSERVQSGEDGCFQLCTTYQFSWPGAAAERCNRGDVCRVWAIRQSKSEIRQLFGNVPSICNSHAENSPIYMKVPATYVGLLMINHIIIFFIAVLERSHIVECVAIFNYEKIPNIDQDITILMIIDCRIDCREVPKMIRKNGQFGTDEWPRP